MLMHFIFFGEIANDYGKFFHILSVVFFYVNELYSITNSRLRRWAAWLKISSDRVIINSKKRMDTEEVKISVLMKWKRI